VKGGLPPLWIFVLACLLAVGGALLIAQGRAPEAGLKAPAAAELTDFQERVLLRLETLRRLEAAAPFLTDLPEAPEPRRYLSGTADPERVAAFRAWVARHGDDPAFGAAVDAAGEPAPCGPGKEPSHTVKEPPPAAPLGLEDDEKCGVESVPSPLFGGG